MKKISRAVHNALFMNEHHYGVLTGNRRYSIAASHFFRALLGISHYSLAVIAVMRHQ